MGNSIAQKEFLIKNLIVILKFANGEVSNSNSFSGIIEKVQADLI